MSPSRTRRLHLGPPIHELLHIRRRDISDAAFADLRRDVQTQYRLVAGYGARPFGRLVLEPAGGQFANSHPRPGRVNPRTAMNVGLGTRVPGKRVGLGDEGCWRTVMNPGVATSVRLRIPIVS